MCSYVDRGSYVDWGCEINSITYLHVVEVFLKGIYWRRQNIPREQVSTKKGVIIAPLSFSHILGDEFITRLRNGQGIAAHIFRKPRV